MKIFNRWGGLVFETSDALVGWNGIASSSGQPCSDGTYFYVIKITLEGKRKYTFKGPLQLQR
jgi:gliding motility-associated-like protein